MPVVRISIEYQVIPLTIGQYGHLYLVAREEGQSDGQGYAISGYPQGRSRNPADNNPQYFGEQLLDINNAYSLGPFYTATTTTISGPNGRPLGYTDDAYDNETEAGRGSTDITAQLTTAFGSNDLDAIWQQMVFFAQQLADAQYMYDLNVDFPTGNAMVNSNSVIASVLSMIGLDVKTVFPTSETDFPGADTILSGAGNDTLYGYAGNNVMLDNGGGDDTFNGGKGDDFISAGAGNDVIIASANADGTGLDRDIYNGGADTDIVDYRQITGFGIGVELNGGGDGTVKKNGAAIFSAEDVLVSIEHVIGSHQSDTFHVISGDDLTIDGDSGKLFFTPPSGFMAANSFFTNEGSDILDLSQLAEGVTIKNGGGSNIGGTLTGGDSSKVIVTFADGKTLTASGIEEVRLGSGDDTLNVGTGVSVTAGVEGLHTKFNMGGGGNDTVELWGHAVLQNGTLMASNGAEVTNFEKIDLASYSFATNQSTLHTLDLGYTYSNTNQTLNWLDYSGFEQKLTFALGATGTVTAQGGPDTDTDHLQGTMNVVGTNNGDTFNINGAAGLVYLGAGDDTIHVQAATGNAFYYSGGRDVFDGQGVTVAVDSTLTLDSLQASFSDGYIIAQTATSITYAFDKNILVPFVSADAPGGKIVFKAAKTETVTAGVDGQWNTSDDTSSTHVGGGQGIVAPALSAMTYSGGTPAINITDFKNLSGVVEGSFIDGGFFGDVISGSGTDNQITGGFGNDTVHSNGGHDYIVGGAGNDTLFGDAGNDVLNGGTGDDTLDGGTGVNILSGGSGKDIFVIGVGGDNTILDYNRADGDVVKLNIPASQDSMSPAKVGNNLVITIGSQTVTLQDFFVGFQGEPTSAQLKSILVHFPFEDPELFFNSAGTLISNPMITEGADNIAGSNGNDVLAALGGDDIIFALDGDDQIDGGSGNDTVFGGAGNDTIDYTSAITGMTVNITAAGGVSAGADIGTDTFFNIENILTGVGDDNITVAADAASVNLVYIAGNDVYTLSATAQSKITFGGDIAASDISHGPVITDGVGVVTAATFSIAGKGTLALYGDNLASQTITVGDGSEFVVTATGIAASLRGTTGNDTFVLSPTYQAYNGLSGMDTMNLSAISSSTAISMQNGTGIVSGGVIGTNYLLGIENVITGTGDDEASLSGYGSIMYTGGNDIYTLTGNASDINVFFDSAIIGNAITIDGFVSSGGHVTSASFNIAGLGTLTLRGVDLTGFSAVLASGDEFRITSTGVEPPSTYFGTEGNDIINLPSGITKVWALNGNDAINGQAGVILYDGGNGTDMLDLSSISGDIMVDMLGGWPSANGTIWGPFGTATIINIENIITGTGNDFINGGYGDNVLQGGAGEDIVYAGIGADTIIGDIDSSNDIYDGGAGPDDISYQFDTVDYSAATQSIDVNLITGIASGAQIGTDTLHNISNVIAGSGNDTITAAAFVTGAALKGGAGDDIYNIDFTSGYSQALTIIDSTGANVLNVIIGNGEAVGWGVGQVHNNIGIIGLNSDHIPTGSFISIDNWYNGTSYRPVSYVSIISPEGTQTFSSQDIESWHVPDARDDDIDAHNLLKVSGNVLQNNGHFADIKMISFSTLNVTAQTLTTANGGEAHIFSDGSFTYSGASGYSGSDSFTYTVTDSVSLLSDTTTVNISNIFDQPNRAPIAINDTFDAQNGSIVHGNVLANDTDPDHNPLAALIETVTSMQGGGATILSNGDVVYQAADGFRGSDNFTYTVQDDQGAMTTATVTISNVFTNKSPVAVDDSISIDGQSVGTGNVLVNDADPDGDILTVLANTFQTNGGGEVNIASNGAFSYQAATGFQGADSFDYIVQDAFGAATIGTVNISGFAQNLPPTIDPAQALVFAPLEQYTTPHEYAAGTPEFPVLHRWMRTPTGVDRDNLTLEQDHAVSVNFVSDGGAFRDTLGWYTIGADGVISNVHLLAEDLTGASGRYGRGGSFHAGDLIGDLGTLPAGTEIGFFMIANGYNINRSLFNKFDAVQGTLSFVTEQRHSPDTATTLADAGRAVDLVFTDTTGRAHDLNGFIYHTASQTLNADGREHALSGLNADGNLQIGFENLYRGGDRDYNDVVIEVKISPDVHTTFPTIAMAQNFTVTDPDDNLIAAATVVLHGQTGDTLDFDQALLAGTNIAATQNADGDWSFTGEDTPDHYQALLRSLTLTSTGTETGMRQLDITITDHDGLSDSSTVNMAIGNPGDTDAFAFLSDDLVFADSAVSALADAATAGYTMKDGQGDDNLTLDISAILDHGDDVLAVLGDAGDQLHITGGTLMHQSDATVNGQLYALYAATSGLSVIVDTDVIVSQVG